MSTYLLYSNNTPMIIIKIEIVFKFICIPPECSGANLSMRS